MIHGIESLLTASGVMFLGCHLEFGESFGSPGGILVPPRPHSLGPGPEILSIDKSLQVTPGHMNVWKALAFRSSESELRVTGSTSQVNPLRPTAKEQVSKAASQLCGLPLLPQCLICVGRVL